MNDVARDGYKEGHFASLKPVCEQGLVVYNGCKQALKDSLQASMSHKSFEVRRSILQKVSAIRAGLLAAAKARPTEAEELREEAAKWEQLVQRIFGLSSLDIAVNVDSVLGADQQGKPGDGSRDLSHAQPVRLFGDDKVLGQCISEGLKTPFGGVAVFTRVRQAFWGTTPVISEGWLLNGPACNSVAKKSLLKDSPLWHYFVMAWNPRSCPAVLFFLEGLSKATMLALSSYVAVQCYGVQGDFGFNPSDSPSYGLTVSLVVMLATSILYEVGQLANDNKKKKKRRSRRRKKSQGQGQLDASTVALALPPSGASPAPLPPPGKVSVGAVAADDDEQMLHTSVDGERFSIAELPDLTRIY